MALAEFSLHPVFALDSCFSVSPIAYGTGKAIVLPLALFSRRMDGFPRERAGLLITLFVFDTSRTRVQDLT